VKCPSCGGRLPARAERCPSCHAVVAPRVEGALAPAPRAVTPPPREHEEPLRDIPGLRRRERTWRDEVRERVRSRRQKRAEAGLPLFEQPEVRETPADAPAPPREAPEPPGPAEAAAPDTMPVRSPARGERRGTVDDVPELVSTPLSDEELADLPLHSVDASHPAPLSLADVPVESPTEAPALVGDVGEPAHAEQDLAHTEQDLGAYDDDEISLQPTPPAPEPLERPARPGERAQAAALDAGLLTVLGTLVLYFTGRAAHVGLESLASSWLWLGVYLGFLGLFYAGYFTGTTGQTPGKMITGLRVVDATGRPPGYARATVRAAAGALGTLVAGLGLLPIAFDPARRAFHDRLLQTRVVHR
jgi:uncharacterized RDD family membrane protein YckC